MHVALIDKLVLISEAFISFQTAPTYGHRQTYEAYRVGQSVGLGATQITIGILCIIFNSVGIGLDGALSAVGHGIWCGLFVSTD